MLLSDDSCFIPCCETRRSIAAMWTRLSTERLAFMDVVVLISAIGEILNFPKIPLTVSVNEYIELAKCYSTAKSGTFVHGILGTVITRLQKENILHKH